MGSIDFWNGTAALIGWTKSRATRTSYSIELLKTVSARPGYNLSGM